MKDQSGYEPNDLRSRLKSSLKSGLREGGKSIIQKAMTTKKGERQRAKYGLPSKLPSKGFVEAFAEGFSKELNRSSEANPSLDNSNNANKFCTACGMSVALEAKFCSSCGNKIPDINNTYGETRHQTEHQSDTGTNVSGGQSTIHYERGAYYEGGVENDARHGRGILYYETGMPMHDGDWENDVPHGKGTFYDEDGMPIYDGDWENDAWHGRGILYYETGMPMYDGDWENDVMHGKGTLYDEDGTPLYDGDFVNGDYIPQSDTGTNVSGGQSTIHYESGAYYEGGVENDARHGRGILYDETGMPMYDGDWENDVPHGKGTSYYEDGTVEYEGDFVNGDYIPQNNDTLSGSEYLNYDNERELNNPPDDGYEGQTRNGVRHGKGRVAQFDGSVYEGNWFEGKMEGYGKFVTAKGASYEGHWRNNVPHGEGTFTKLDGSIIKGKWVNGAMHGRATWTAIYGSKHFKYKVKFRKGVAMLPWGEESMIITARKEKNDTHGDIYEQLLRASQRAQSSVDKGDILEAFCAVLLNRMGYKILSIPGGAGDGGVDIEAVEDNDTGTRKIIAQCKNYLGSRVGADDVMKLIGSVAHFGGNVGFIFTTGTFTSQALSTAQNTSSSIKLIDGADLKQLSRKYLSDRSLTEVLRAAQQWK